MTIKIGNSSINSIYVGDTKVKAVYLGNQLVYSSKSEPSTEIDDSYNYYVFDTNKASEYKTTTVTLQDYRAGDTTEWNGLTDWGDGTINTERYHRYSKHGIYTVKTKYVIHQGSNTSTSTELMLIKCLNINKNITNYATLFMNCENLTYVNTTYLDTSNVTSLDRTFYYCKSLTSLDLSSWNTNNVKDMYCLFYACTNLKFLNLSNWNMDKVTENNYYGMLRSSKLTIDNIIMTNCNDATKAKIQNALSAE